MGKRMPNEFKARGTVDKQLVRGRLGCARLIESEYPHEAFQRSLQQTAPIN